jgi:hypothetical protein
MNPRPHIPSVLDDPRDDLSESDRALAEDLEKYGFHYITVGQSAADAEEFPDWEEVPDWTYSIGLYVSFGHPEIVISNDSDLRFPVQAARERIPVGTRFCATPWRGVRGVVCQKARNTNHKLRCKMVSTGPAARIPAEAPKYADALSGARGI